MRPSLIKRATSRRKFLATLGLGGGTALGTGAYMRFFEPGMLKVRQHHLPSSHPPAEIRVVHLSDLHASPQVSLEQIDAAIQQAVRLKPDLICLTGDFITSKYEKFDDYAEVLRPLSKTAPTFACLGNHDGGSWSARHGGYPTTREVRKLFERSRIEPLHNTSTRITVNGRDLCVVGVGDLWARELDATAAFRKVGLNDYTLVLSHNPDSKTELARFQWNLLLCGHTHGGQLYLPIVGRPFAPVRDKRYAAGLNRWEDRWIHTSCGVGNLHGMRLNCPPEISLIKLG